MAEVAGASTSPEKPTMPGGGTAQPRPATPSVSRRVLERALSLREGSIIVVTIVVAIYFSVNTSTFFTGANFKTLLPYFAPLALLGAARCS
jgi:simple sugar transport system permease protein